MANGPTYYPLNELTLGMRKAYRPIEYPTTQLAPPPSTQSALTYTPGPVASRALLAQAGWEQGVGQIERALTTAGMGDWRQEEAARQAEAQRLLRQVPQDVIKQKEAVQWTPEGPQGWTPGGVASVVAESVFQPATAAAVVGGAASRLPHPAAKAAGFALSAAANAAQTAGQSAQSVEAQGGSEAAQKQAALGSAFVGAGEGVLDALVLNRLVGMAGLDKAAAKQSLTQLANAGNSEARARLTALVAEEAKLKAAPFATKAANFIKEAGTTVAVGAGTEAIQEGAANAGQQAVENVALQKPTWEGVPEAAKMGAAIGGISGGIMSGGLHAATQAVTKLTPEAKPGVANTTGEDQGFTGEQTPFTKSGIEVTKNINLAAKANNATAQALDTAPIVSSTEVGVAPTTQEAFNARNDTVQAAQAATAELSRSIGAEPTPQQGFERKPKVSPAIEGILNRPAETSPWAKFTPGQPGFAEATDADITKFAEGIQSGAIPPSDPHALAFFQAYAPQVEAKLQAANAIEPVQTTPATSDFKQSYDYDNLTQSGKNNAVIDDLKGIRGMAVPSALGRGLVFPEAATWSETQINDLGQHLLFLDKESRALSENKLLSAEQQDYRENLIYDAFKTFEQSFHKSPYDTETTTPLQDQATQEQRIAAVTELPTLEGTVPSIEDRLGHFTTSNRYAIGVADPDESRRMKRHEVGGLRVGLNVEGQHVIDSLTVGDIKVAIAQGKRELADAMLTQLEDSKNHEDTHRIISFRGERGEHIYIPEVQQIAQEAVTDADTNAWMRDSAELLVHRKVYQDQFRDEINTSLPPEAPKIPKGTILTVDDLMSTQEGRLALLNELLAGHPNAETKRSRVSDDIHARYLAGRQQRLSRIPNFPNRIINGAIPGRLSPELVSQLQEVRKSSDNLVKAEESIQAKLDEMAVDDPATVEHVRRTTELLKFVLDTFKDIPVLAKILTPEGILHLRLAAMGHDLGKAGMEDILHKDNLTDAEVERIKKHAERSRIWLEENGVPAEIAQIAGEHHTKPSDQKNPLSKILQMIDFIDSVIGGPGSGHEYPLRIGDTTGPRTRENVLTVIQEAKQRGSLDPEMADLAYNMVKFGILPAELEAQLQSAEGVTPGPTIAEPVAAIPPEGTRVEGAEHYYIDTKGQRTELPKRVATSRVINLTRLDSIVERAVQKMHTLLGHKAALVKRVNNTTYTVGDQTYNLEADGNDFRVLPQRGYDENYDVTIEQDAGQYKVRIDDYNQATGAGAKQARASNYIEQGQRAAAAILSNKTALGENIKGYTAAFRGANGNVIATTTTALRKAGAALSSRANESIADKYANLVEGIAHAVAAYGEMVGTDLNSLVVSDEDTYGKVTFAEAQRFVGSETDLQLKAVRRERAARVLLGQLIPTRADEAAVRALADEINGELRNNPKLDRTAWLNGVKDKAAAVAQDYSGMEFTGKVKESSADVAEKAAESIKHLLTRVNPSASIDQLVDLFNSLETKAGTDIAATEGRTIKARGSKVALHALPILRNLLAAKRANPSLNPHLWLREQLNLAEKDAQYASTREEDASIEEVSEEDVADALRAQATVGKTTPPSTQEVGTSEIVNRAASIPSRVVSYLNGMLRTLRIPTAFTLYDSDSALSPEVQAIVSERPYASQFIALDNATTGRQHVIYIATKNADGSPRSRADQAVDLAHEIGHFVQRVSLDAVVDSAIKSGEKGAMNLVADLLGLNENINQEGDTRHPLLVYSSMSDMEKDSIDEIFADRLAQEMLTANETLRVDNVTYVDVISANDEKGFFQRLAALLTNLFNKLKSVGSYAGNFNEYLRAMTGREDSLYHDIVEGAGRSQIITKRKQARTQYQTLDPMARTSQFRKMLDSRLAKSVAKGITHWFGLDSELRSMKSKTATWLARTYSGATGDVMRREFADNFQKFVQFSWGSGVLREDVNKTPIEWGLGNKYSAILNNLPVYNKTLFGFSLKSTPQGNAFMEAVHRYGSLQSPLEAIPANLNFTVEELVNGRKNVTLNVRDTVAAIRQYYTRDLHNYQTAEGMPLKKIVNYWPFEITRETVMNFESEIRAELAKDLENIPVWVRTPDGRDILEYHSEKGKSQQWINDFIDSFKYGVAVDRDPFQGESDEEVMRKKSIAAMGRVGILGGNIAGTTNNATKARKLSDARRLALMDFSEADVASMIMRRTGEAIKSRAADHMWGSWVVVGGRAGTTGKYDFTLMDRESYRTWVLTQVVALKDQVMEMHGRPDLRDEAINAYEGSKRHLIESRKAIYKAAMNPENLSPQAVRAREMKATMDAALERNYYSTFSKIDAALAQGEAAGDIDMGDVIRIQDVLLPAMLGRLGQKEITASWRAAQAYIMTGMNVMYLPMMVLSAIAELPQIGIRMYDPILGNGMFKSQAAMLKGVGEMLLNPDGTQRKEAKDVLSAIGMIKDSAIESAITTSTEGEFLPVKVKQFNQKFFEWTLIKRFTEFERMVAYKIGKQALIQYAQRASAGGPDAAQAKAQADAVGLDISATMQYMGNEAEWIKTKNFQDAIYNWIDEANLRPGPNTRPARMSDPRFAVVWYLKDFSWAMQARTLSYLAQQAKLQPGVLEQLTPWIAAAIPMMIAGGLGAYARDLLTNQIPAAAIGVKPYDRYKHASDVVSAAVTRSGMLGPMELLYNFGDNYAHRGLPWVSLVSPLASLLQEAALTGSVNTAKRHIPIIAMASPPVKKAMLSALGLGPGYAQ